MMLQLLAALQDVLADDMPLPAPQPSLGFLESQVRRIQAGDQDLRNQVITECLPYIKGVLHHMLQHTWIEQSDEYSVALIAFNESIDRYRWETRVPFLRFAGLVINRRVIDWLRQQRQHRTVQLDGFLDDQEDAALDRLASSPAELIWQNMEIEEEITVLIRRMQAYDLTFSRLTQVFPSHRDSRLNCLHAARILLADPFLRQRFEAEHRLPAAELSRRGDIPLKTIERNRLSIIFLALLESSGLDMIKAYLKAYSKEDA
jgi:RNA polymerase sigma factor